MNQRTIIITLVIVLAVLCGALFWYSRSLGIGETIVSGPPPETSPMLATLDFQQGDVQMKSGNSSWQKASSSAVLKEGDSLKTGTDGRAIVVMDNGDITRLSSSTEITFTDLKKEFVKISQVSGMTYGRLANNAARNYQVVTNGVTVEGDYSAFNVQTAGQLADIQAIQGTIRVTTNDDQQYLNQGTAAEGGPNKEILAAALTAVQLKNDWLIWNKEQDSKYDYDLGAMNPWAGPKLAITDPQNMAVIYARAVTIDGTVSDNKATLTIVGKDLPNEAGQFSLETPLADGKNVIEVTATDVIGNRTLQDVTVNSAAPGSTVPSLTLSGETKKYGVYLSWTAAPTSAFRTYIVSRLDINNSGINNGYLARLEASEESYVDDTTAVNAVYNYRVCGTTLGNQTFCSNVISIQGKLPINGNTNLNVNLQANLNRNFNINANTNINVNRALNANGNVSAN